MLVPLVLSDEHASIQEAVSGLLGARYDVWRAIDADGDDPALWTQLVEMGLPAMEIPESLGGGGYGPVEAFLAFREMGRTLLASPFFATVALGAHMLVEAGSEAAQAQYLPAIAAGELTATVAICESSGSWWPTDVELRARRDGSDVRLSGDKHYVLDAGAAQLYLIVARDGDELAVFAVRSDAPGLDVVPLRTLDLTRPMGDLRLRDVPAARVSPPGDCTGAVQRALRSATLALVAEQIGGAEQALATAVQYAKDRVQFGSPIGSFQAVKHKLADMAVDVEHMLSAGWRATQALADADPEAPAVLHLAKAFCSEAYFRVAADSIQVHGGIGFTWEHPAHLYFRRAKSSELILGTPAEHRDALLSRLTSAVVRT